jgi:hypothetical protein
MKPQKISPDQSHFWQKEQRSKDVILPDFKICYKAAAMKNSIALA